MILVVSDPVKLVVADWIGAISNSNSNSMICPGSVNQEKRDIRAKGVFYDALVLSFHAIGFFYIENNERLVFD